MLGCCVPCEEGPIAGLLKHHRTCQGSPKHLSVVEATQLCINGFQTHHDFIKGWSLLCNGRPACDGGVDGLNMVERYNIGM